MADAPIDVRQRTSRTPLHRRIAEYARLVGRMLGDRRVAAVDKLLVAAAVAYGLTPIDLLPDFIPFMGQVDDVAVLVTAFSRLFEHAGRSVVLSHWRLPADELDPGWVRRLAFALAFLFPRQPRRRLRAFARWRS